MSLNRQRGVAAITAILVVALATALAVSLVWNLNLDLRRTESTLLRDQASEYALGAESWALDILRQDREKDGSTPRDDLQEAWAQDLPPLPIEGGSITGHLEDLQGRFDLNNLVTLDGRKDPVAYEQFQRLLSALDLDPRLADAVVDWIDPDQQPELEGAEDDRYTNLEPPYRPADFWLISPSELRAVLGFDQVTYATLRPYVTALPVLFNGQPQKINVNTASKEVLRSLDASLTDVDAEQLAQNRPYDDRTAFEKLVDPAIYANIGVASDYFLLTVTVSIGTTRLTMYSLLERAGTNVRPLLRSFDVN